MKYIMNSSDIQYLDLSISVRIQAAWWLAKEDVAILKFSSLVKSKLTSHRYSSFFYKLFSFTNVIIVYILKGILTKMLAGILLIHVIGKYFDKLILQRIVTLPFFGIMVDETTDISTTTQHIVYIKYLGKSIDD